MCCMSTYILSAPSLLVLTEDANLLKQLILIHFYSQKGLSKLIQQVATIGFKNIIQTGENWAFVNAYFQQWIKTHVGH